MVKLRINDSAVNAKSGETILMASRRHNIAIPSLCTLKKQTNGYRSVCRLCIVEIKGSNALHQACSTVVAEGMDVYTNTPRVKKIQKTLMGFILDEHGSCGNEDCEIEKLAEVIGASPSRVTLCNTSTTNKESFSSEYIGVNASLCIHCDRCIQACTYQVITRSGRGAGVVFAFDDDVPLEHSSCTHCGDCINVCPSGALTANSRM